MLDVQGDLCSGSVLSKLAWGVCWRQRALLPLLCHVRRLLGLFLLPSCAERQGFGKTERTNDSDTCVKVVFKSYCENHHKLGFGLLKFEEFPDTFTVLYTISSVFVRAKWEQNGSSVEWCSKTVSLKAERVRNSRIPKAILQEDGLEVFPAWDPAHWMHRCSCQGSRTRAALSLLLTATTVQEAREEQIRVWFWCLIPEELSTECAEKME